MFTRSSPTLARFALKRLNGERQGHEEIDGALRMGGQQRSVARQPHLSLNKDVFLCARVCACVCLPPALSVRCHTPSGPGPAGCTG